MVAIPTKREGWKMVVANSTLTLVETSHFRGILPPTPVGLDHHKTVINYATHPV